MLFLLKLCGYVARKLGDGDEGNVKDRLCLGALFASQVFAEVTTRNKGFGEFGAIGSFHVKVQDYFLTLLWDAIKDNMSDFSSALTVYHPGVTADTVRPYMMKTNFPNIVSFFHLTFQSLHHDFVSPFHVASLTKACNHCQYGGDLLRPSPGILGIVCLKRRRCFVFDLLVGFGVVVYVASLCDLFSPTSSSSSFMDTHTISPSISASLTQESSVSK